MKSSITLPEENSVQTVASPSVSAPPQTSALSNSVFMGESDEDLDSLFIKTVQKNSALEDDGLKVGSLATNQGDLLCEFGESFKVVMVAMQSAVQVQTDHDSGETGDIFKNYLKFLIFFKHIIVNLKSINIYYF